MRVRTVNEKAVAKTLAFLIEVKNIADIKKPKPITLLYSEHNISKATGTACKQLNLFKISNTGYYFWLAGQEPDREMAIKVLELLRRRNDKMVAVPLEGFEQLLMDLKEIVKNSKPKTDARRDVGNYEKQISDKKHDDFVKIVCSIAGGYYSGGTGGMEHNIINFNIIEASKDLLTKIYAK